MKCARKEINKIERLVWLYITEAMGSKTTNKEKIIGGRSQLLAPYLTRSLALEFISRETLSLGLNKFGNLILRKSFNFLSIYNILRFTLHFISTVKYPWERNILHLPASQLNQNFYKSYPKMVLVYPKTHLV